MDPLSESHGLRQGFDKLTQHERESLLDGPSVTLVVYHSGTDLEYLHQCSSADGHVKWNRLRQMREQVESNHERILVEFPRAALKEAIPNAHEYFTQEPNDPKIYFDMRHVLPGYTMEVLDWYGKALGANTWFDFPMQHMYEDMSQWYFYYIYVTMRLLGMTTFAVKLQRYLECHLAELASDYGGYVHFLRHLSKDDPLLMALARRSAKLNSRGKMPMNDAYLHKINCRFPHFRQVTQCLSRMLREDALLEDVSQRDVLHSDRQLVEEDVMENDLMDVGDMRQQLSQTSGDDGYQGEELDVNRLSNALDDVHIAG